MAYDIMGNLTGYDDNTDTVDAIDAEEKKRRKELEEQKAKEAQTQAQAQAQVNPNQMGPTMAALGGTQPANPLNQAPAPAPTTSGGFNFLPTANAAPAPQPVQQAPAPAPAPQPVQQAPAQAAVAPTTQDQYLAQNESGNNPNIGFHNPALSSAYGTYGITAPAYKDIQSADPYFANKDITQLTPEDQTRANQTYQGVLGKQLQAQGVEVNPGNLAAAHFAGAKGLADYLNNGTISKAAAEANGGAARVAHIIEERRNMAPAPASGATPMPEVGNADHIAKLNSNDVNNHMIVATDATATPGAKKDATERAYDAIKTDTEMAKANKFVDQNADNPNKLLPAINKKGEEGSYIKAVLFARLGLTDLARQEQEKISPTLKSSATMLDGQNYHIKQNVDGEIVKAWDQQGNPVNDKGLANLNANYLALEGATTGQTMGFDAKGDTISHTILPNGRGVQWKNETTGEILKNAPEGYHTGKDQKAMLADSAAKQASAKMDAENVKSISQGAGPKFTKEEIQAAGTEARNRVLGITPSTPNAPPSTPNAPPSTPNAPPSTPNAPPSTPNAPPSTARSKYTPQVLAEVDSIVKGNKLPPTGLGAANYFNRTVTQALNELHPTYDANAAKEKVKENTKIITDFTPGGVAGKQVVAFATAANHINDDFRPAIKALNNGDYPAANAFMQKLSTWTGNASNVNNFKLVAQAMGDEVVKTLTNGGPGALADREKIQERFRSVDNAKTLSEAADYAERLMAGKTEVLAEQYARTGRKDFYTSVVPNPHIKAVVDKIQAERNVNENKPSSGTTASGIKWKRVD